MIERVELRTERLLLRPFREEDVDEARAYRDDAEFARYLPHIPQPFTQEDAEAYVDRNMHEPWELLPTFAIVIDGELIGTINFEVDPRLWTAMLGFAIAREQWGKGIAVEAATAAITWAFEAYDLDKIWAAADARNLRSQRVLEKLGMHRQAARDDRSDDVFYALSRPDWPLARPEG